MANSTNIRVRGFNQHLRKLLSDDVPDAFYYGKASNANTVGAQNNEMNVILKAQNSKTACCLKEWDARATGFDRNKFIRPKNTEGKNLDNKVFGSLVNPIHNAYGEMVKNSHLDYRGCYDHYASDTCADNRKGDQNDDFYFHQKNNNKLTDPGQEGEKVRDLSLNIQNQQGGNVVQSSDDRASLTHSIEKRLDNRMDMTNNNFSKVFCNDQNITQKHWASPKCSDFALFPRARKAHQSQDPYYSQNQKYPVVRHNNFQNPILNNRRLVRAPESSRENKSQNLQVSEAVIPGRNGVIQDSD